MPGFEVLQTRPSSAQVGLIIFEAEQEVNIICFAQAKPFYPQVPDLLPLRITRFWAVISGLHRASVRALLAGRGDGWMHV